MSPPRVPPVSGSNQFAFGWAKRTTAVRSSGVSTSEIVDHGRMFTEAFDSVVTHCQVNLTSFEVKGVPSDHTTPSRSLSVALVRSSASWPFSTEGTSVARYGMIVPSGR